jgi:Ca2+-binding RTX toxin-like protein
MFTRIRQAESVRKVTCNKPAPWQPRLEVLEDRTVPAGFVDGFEGPTLNPFWSAVTQSGSVTFPSTAAVHTGLQSVQLNSTNTGSNKYIALEHTFAQPVFGRFSVWVYDTGANQASGNYISMSLDNFASSVYAGIGAYDYNFGDGSHYHAALVSNVDTGVPRSEAWHNFEIAATAAATTFSIDNQLVATLQGIAVDRVNLWIGGPSWRPAFTSYFDDFEYTDIASNAAPAVDAGADQTVVRGAPLSSTGSFADPDADTWTATVDYGDGSGVRALALNSDKTFALSHTYTATGSYTATVTVTDSQGNVGTDTVAVTVTAVALLPDPCMPGATALFVGGTTGNDSIVVSPSGNSGAVTVTLNGASLGTFQPTGRVVVYAQAGDDDVQVAGGVRLPAWLYGGDGNDRLKGGGGNNVLLGGAGDDLLVGGNDRDFLIGGTGADRIVGNAADDILIAGVTAHDANEAALCAVLKEWTRTDKGYADRVADLMNGTGLNGPIVLNTTTVFSDSDADVLTGSSGSDWFLFDDHRDRVTDLHDELFINDLLFING